MWRQESAVLCVESHRPPGERQRQWQVGIWRALNRCAAVECLRQGPAARDGWFESDASSITAAATNQLTSLREPDLKREIGLCLCRFTQMMRAAQVIDYWPMDRAGQRTLFSCVCCIQLRAGTVAIGSVGPIAATETESDRSLRFTCCRPRIH